MYCNLFVIFIRRDEQCTECRLLAVMWRLGQCRIMKANERGKGMKRIEEGKNEESAMKEDIMEVEVTGILERRFTGKCIVMQKP